MKKIIWKPVKDFEGLYEVSNFGVVRSLDKIMSFKNGSKVPRRGKLLVPNTVCGYHQQTLTKNKKPHYRKNHRLVAEAFLEPVPGKYYVNHKDGIKTNNHVDNLEYCTMAENNKHAGEMNLKPIGTNHINSKFTKEDLVEIQKLLDEGNLSHKKIALIFGVHRTTISRFSRSDTYKKEYLNEK